MFRLFSEARLELGPVLDLIGAENMFFARQDNLGQITFLQFHESVKCLGCLDPSGCHSRFTPDQVFEEVHPWYLDPPDPPQTTSQKARLERTLGKHAVETSLQSFFPSASRPPRKWIFGDPSMEQVIDQRCAWCA